MTVTHKRFVIIFTALAMGLATLAWAGPGAGFGRGPGGMRGDPEQRWAMMQERQAARLNLLQESLDLKLEQEPAWQAFEAAQQAHRAVMKDNRASVPATRTVPEHFAERIQFMEQRLTTLKAVASAADDLYAVLTPAQQAVLDTHFAQRGGRRWGP
jgi:Spy/CpxP family protein refolding chaperone